MHFDCKLRLQLQLSFGNVLNSKFKNQNKILVYQRKNTN